MTHVPKRKMRKTMQTNSCRIRRLVLVVDIPCIFFPLIKSDVDSKSFVKLSDLSSFKTSVFAIILL